MRKPRIVVAVGDAPRRYDASSLSIVKYKGEFMLSIMYGREVIFVDPEEVKGIAFNTDVRFETCPECSRSFYGNGE